MWECWLGTHDPSLFLYRNEISSFFNIYETYTVRGWKRRVSFDPKTHGEPQRGLKYRGSYISHVLITVEHTIRKRWGQNTFLLWPLLNPITLYHDLGSRTDVNLHFIFNRALG